ncbi:hypothetical protein ACQP1P_38170 [Dactylosporangium sp. CA-052675]|uniref:hypothetical protein n=1 Tax=Dactylosporangium sp. CA-052675 TaxID=3239927 RepID=UPI003D8ECF19
MNAKALTAATVVLAAGLLLAACTRPQHHSGDAAPAGAPASPTGAPVSPPPSTSAPTGPPASTSAPTSRAATASATKDLTVVLGPDGLGSLKLGMNRQQALATQVVASLPEATNGCTTGILYGAHRPYEGAVWLHASEGVSAIYAFSDVHTREGLHLGSTYDELMRTYPDWQPVDLGQRDDRGYAKVPGNANAVWRIETSDGKVASLALQLRHQGCYE